MRIVIAGSSGYLGTALTSRLRGHGHEVLTLVRREPTGEHERRWDPYRAPLGVKVLADVDAVVNLCGASVAGKRWNPAYKGLLEASRVEPTRVLAEAVAAANVPVLVNASAVGRYGDTGDREVDESAPPSDDFLGRLCRRWEGATAAAVTAGKRVVMLRTGHVLSGESILLRRLVPIFRLGIGGRFGSGRQYIPWISREDWVSAVEFALGDAGVRGPVNLVGPTPVTNGEFTRELAAVLHRPAPFVVPGFAVRAVAGEAAVELLRGAKVRPAALERAGYSWRHGTVREALEWSLGKTAG